MSAGIQERLQLSRMPLDKWTKREQLCLASAVSCSGDQNWITVSRTLKSVCGNGSDNESRPADWYSQKNCAVQYGHLLESVETTKRKKRNSEGISSPATVETPTELLLRRLTEERLLEIKQQMRRDQEEYKKVFREIEALQSDKVTEQELKEMWQQIENELENQRINEMKLENRMREREQHRKELANIWRNMGSGNAVVARRSHAAVTATDTTSVDMDVEEITNSSNSSIISTVTPKAGQQTAPSPLLTSLLKSPTPTSNSSNNNSLITPNPPASSAGSVARATAPTITSLLTSGAGAIPNQPAITLKNTTDSTFITRPISGPATPGNEPHTPTTPTTPSQAAPTLSMLLEKNKTTSKATESNSASTTATEPASQESNTVAAEPMVATPINAAEGNTNAGTGDSDEADAIEEQQLLEELNIDDIMEGIDIDMNSVSDILQNVDDVADSPTAAKPEDNDFENKLDALKGEQVNKKSDSKPTAQAVASAEKEPKETPKPVEVVIGSSDESNDNLPLATVASQEGKESSQTNAEDASNEDAEKNVASKDLPVEEITETVTLITSSSEENTVDATSVATEKLPEPTAEEPVDTTSAASTVKSAANVNETDEHETAAPTEETNEQPVAKEVTEDPHKEKVNKAEESKAPLPPADKTEEKAKAEPPANEAKTLPSSAAASSSIHDTDEESSSLTDSSKQDEPMRSSRTKSKPRQSTSDESRAEPTPSTNASATGTTAHPAPVGAGISTAPVRPPLLRKLPHRDRSESPMIDDDTATASDHSTTARTNQRRRCSSTPVLDSIPNSPASSEHTDDRRETRGASKKIFLGIYNTLSESKHAAPFRRAFHDEHPYKHAELCLRPMDLPTLKRNIDSGHMRSISELQRDVMLMCHNVLFMYKPGTTQHKAARLFLQECQAIKEFAAHHEAGPSKPDKEKPKGGRSGSRKSQRHH